MAASATTDTRFNKLRKFYRLSYRVVRYLARWVPGFYSDWTLVAYCTTGIRYGLTAFPSVRPDLPADAKLLAVLQEVANAAAVGRDLPGILPQLETAVAAILHRLPFEPPATSRQDLISRLSLVTPKILVFPQPTDDRQSFPPLAAFADLCVHFAKRLLRDNAIELSSHPTFREQLTRLTDRQVGDHSGPSLPMALGPTPFPPWPTEEWFESIEAAALELTAQQDLAQARSLAPARTIHRGIMALSAALAAFPPFPDLSKRLSQHYPPPTPSQHPAPAVQRSPVSPPQAAQPPAAAHAPKRSFADLLSFYEHRGDVPPQPTSSAADLLCTTALGSAHERPHLWRPRARSSGTLSCRCCSQAQAGHPSAKHGYAPTLFSFPDESLRIQRSALTPSSTSSHRNHCQNPGKGPAATHTNAPAVFPSPNDCLRVQCSAPVASAIASCQRDRQVRRMPRRVCD